MGQRIVKALEGRLPEGQSSRYLLPVLSNVISLSPEALTEGKYVGDLRLSSGFDLYMWTSSADPLLNGEGHKKQRQNI